MKRFALLAGGLVVATASLIGIVLAQPHDAGHHAHGAAPATSSSVRDHYGMLQGEAGVTATRDAMMRMAVHQYLLGQATTDPELKQLAESPEMKRAIGEVKALFADQKAFDAKKAELLKDHDEMLSILAHALMQQDADLKHKLDDAATNAPPH